MAVVTDKLKKQVISFIQNDFDSDANYYIGIGRSEDWNDSDIAPTTLRSKREERNFRNGLQSVKKVIDTSFVVPRFNWSSGAIYSPYDDAQVGYPSQSYYVLNDNNQVYMVIEQAKNTDGTAKVSTVQPSGNTSGTAFQTADGYIWKFLYSISALDANKFIAANFMPVKLATAADSDAAGVEQLAVQNAAVVGQIIGVAVDSGGTGYTGTPSVTITGDGTDAKFSATIDGGVVTKCEVIDSSGTLAFGSGYTNAVATLSTSGSTIPAKVRPIFATPLGLGGDARDDLKSTSFMFHVKPDGTENNDFIVGNDFRQVGLIKGIKDSAGVNDFSGSTGIALKKLTFASQTSNFTVDKTIEGATSGAKALIDRVDSANALFFHQTEVTGFVGFDSGENITEVDGTGAGTLTTPSAGQLPFTTPEVLVNTGDVLYIDNRASVSRATDQTEDIKVVIQI